MQLNQNQKNAQKAVVGLAAQFNQSENPELILQMKNLLKGAGLTLNKAGIPPEHIQLVKQHWDSVSVPA